MCVDNCPRWLSRLRAQRGAVSKPPGDRPCWLSRPRAERGAVSKPLGDRSAKPANDPEDRLATIRWLWRPRPIRRSNPRQSHHEWLPLHPRMFRRHAVRREYSERRASSRPAPDRKRLALHASSSAGPARIPAGVSQHRRGLRGRAPCPRLVSRETVRPRRRTVRPASGTVAHESWVKHSNTRGSSDVKVGAFSRA